MTTAATITIGDVQITASPQRVARAILETFLNGERHVAPPSIPVRIGDYWAGHGGEYVGIGRLADGQQYHLILGLEAPEQLSHADALKYVQGLEIDGHRDFSLMTRRSAPLCFANLPERFKKEWYWLVEHYEADAACAWTQHFSYGYQLYTRKASKFWVRAVRSELIQ